LGRLIYGIELQYQHLCFTKNKTTSEHWLKASGRKVLK
jgi:hypothetical protein